MPRLFDINKDTGITQYFEYDPASDTINITSTQEVSDILDHAKQLREQAKVKGQVETWSHYATIPTIVELELLKKGLKLSDKNDMPAIIKEIEVNYPYLKTTTKRHAVR